MLAWLELSTLALSNLLHDMTITLLQIYIKKIGNFSAKQLWDFIANHRPHA